MEGFAAERGVGRAYASIATVSDLSRLKAPRVRPLRTVALPLLLLLALAAVAGCSGVEAPPPAEEGSGQDESRPAQESQAPPAGDAESSVPSPREQAAPGKAPSGTGRTEAPQGQGGSPLDGYIDEAFSYLQATQLEDGSWEYFHSATPDFAEPEPHAGLFGTMMTLMNLTHTGFERTQVFDRGAGYLRGRMLEGGVWSLYEPGAFNSQSWFEPDADDTAVALVLLADRLALSRTAVADLRALFDRHRAESGLYRTYFDGFHGEKGFVPDPDTPSLGVNLNILGFFGKYELERSGLVEAISQAAGRDLYWERTPFYRSLAIIACLASNALEHGATEAQDLLGRFLGDLKVGDGPGMTPPGEMNNLHLAAYIKARSHHCLVTAQPCRDLDQAVMVLARRRNRDGSWDPGPFYEYDVNQEALVAFLERRDFTLPRARGGVAYDVDRALASPGTTRYYDGSRGETTSFGLKALVFYRELIRRRQVFALAPREE